MIWRRTLPVFFLAWLLAAPGLSALAAELPDRRAARGTAEAPASARETLVELLLQFEALQNELRQLRGQVEVQTHEIERLKARQRDLTADLDRRLRELERRGGVASPAATTDSTAPGAAPPVAAVPVAPAATAPAVVGEQQEYDAAFALMKQGFYDRGAKAFREFIARHPRSALAGNAQYWIGEAAYYVRNFRLAIEEFSKAARDYPTSNKVPDALLKIGYSHYELAEWAKANEVLTQIVSKYPNTAVAKSAQKRLAQMKKEGH